MRPQRSSLRLVCALVASIGIFGLLAACQPVPLSQGMGSEQLLPVAVRRATVEETRLAVIGDFGMDNSSEAEVAALIKGWNPDAIITVGDNNYPDGSAATIDANIGKYFHEYIYPYRGAYGAGATTNRFFPVLGNHDWHTVQGMPPLPYPHQEYFDLPGNERYYDVRLGPLHLFAIDSDINEPDGIESTSVQADWLRAQLSRSSAPWRLVFMHHPPYSSSSGHGSTAAMQWPFAEWGAHAVFAGHDHFYERLGRDGIHYFVNGIGGAQLYPIGAPVAGSQVRFNGDHGALLIEATSSTITYTLATHQGVVIDQVVEQADQLARGTAPHAFAIERRLTSSESDAEESLLTGFVNLVSSDLELVNDTDDDEPQVVGLRFEQVDVPKGARLGRVYIEFTVDEASTAPTNINFHGEAGDDPRPFVSVNADLTSRTRTTAAVHWSSVPGWPAVDWKWRTPNLAPIVQELIDRPGWQPGQSMVFFVSGSGRRTGEAFDGSPEAAPVLRVELLWSDVLFLPLVLQRN